MADSAAALRAVRALATARTTWTVLVDGRAGAGKSTLARELAAATGAALVRLDDLYPGWDGLEAGAEAVRSGVLAPRATGRDGVWRRWDWAADRAAETHLVPATGGLICEGCGVLTRRSASIATLALWVELDAGRRRRRALLRDGDAFAPHWDRWAAQEAAVLAAEASPSLADLVIDGLTVRPMSSRFPVRSSAMSDTSESAKAEPVKYVAEYVDGPLEGTTEHRYLENGAIEPRVTQYALVDGTDAMFEYVAGETRELNGEQYVQYSFDQKDSDVLQGQADPDDESQSI